MAALPTLSSPFPPVPHWEEPSPAQPGRDRRCVRSSRGQKRRERGASPAPASKGARSSPRPALALPGSARTSALSQRRFGRCEMLILGCSFWGCSFYGARFGMPILWCPFHDAHFGGPILGCPFWGCSFWGAHFWVLILGGPFWGCPFWGAYFGCSFWGAHFGVLILGCPF